MISRSLLRTVCLLLTWTAVLVQSSDSDNDSDSDCRQAGYNPSQLACRTCQLLPDENQDTCLACCQDYKDVELMSKPYEAAVLIVGSSGSSSRGGGGSDEFTQFLKEDWDDLVQSKGAARLMQVARADRGSGGGGYSYYMSPPTVLYLLDEKHSSTGKTKSASEYAKVAKETLYLDEWKRDDIRDMLATLLP